MSGPLPAYRRTGSALHGARASIASAYIAALCAVAVVFDHPLVLCAALVAVVAAGLAARVGRELARAARFALPLALLITFINPLVSREGLTLLISGPAVAVVGRVDITLEAVVYGFVFGLRVGVLMLAFALYSAAVDPDEILRLFGRLSLRSSLAASIAARLVPVLGRDAGRLADAYVLRAARPAEDDRFLRLRRGAILTRALAAGALERAVDLAAALEVRGFAATPARGGARPRTPWSRHDLVFAGAALALTLLAFAGGIGGVASFDPYPTLQADGDLLSAGLALAVIGLVLLPFGLATLWRLRLERLDSRSRNVVRRADA